VNAVTVRLKRFSYTAAWDLLLLKAVATSGAHIAAHGQTTARYQEAVSLFLQAAPTGSLKDVVSPTWKSLRDRFKKITTDRREENKANAGASGIIEVRGEREVLLDDLLHGMGEHEELKRSERDEKTEKEKQLVRAGERIREQALNRQSCSASDEVVDLAKELSTQAERPTLSSKVKRSRLTYESDGEDKQILFDDMRARRETESKRLRLEEMRLEMDKSRDERDANRDAKVQDREERKLILAERKTEIELEERREALKERKSMIDVLASLASKLQ